LKVWPLMVEANMSSEKVALMLAEGSTPLAPPVGTVLLTLGRVVSVGGLGGGLGVVTSILP
jgi:hypothetical protein